MTNPLLNQTFSQQAQQQYQQAQNQAPGMSLSQLAAQSYNQFGNAYNAYAQLGQQAQMAAQQSTYSHHMWVWNGVAMDVASFAQHAYGDTPEATHFILKYKDVI